MVLFRSMWDDNIKSTDWWREFHKSHTMPPVLFLPPGCLLFYHRHSEWYYQQELGEHPVLPPWLTERNQKLTVVVNSHKQTPEIGTFQ